MVVKWRELEIYRASGFGWVVGGGNTQPQGPGWGTQLSNYTKQQSWGGGPDVLVGMELIAKLLLTYSFF